MKFSLAKVECRPFISEILLRSLDLSFFLFEHLLPKLYRCVSYYNVIELLILNYIFPII